MARNLTGTAANTNYYILENGEQLTIDGAGGTDTLSFDRLPKSYFTIKAPNANGYIEIDSVSGASAFYQIFVKNVETLKFSNGATTVDLTTLFDTTPPTVSSISPTDNATGVAVNADIVVTFSETIAKGTGNILLKDNTGAIIETYNAATSTNLSVAGAVLTINPTADLSNLSAYTVEFSAGTIKDAKGNKYAGATYHFTTEADIVNPFVTAFSPADGAVNVLVNSNVVLTFNETVAAGTGNILLKDGNGTVIETYDVASNTTNLSMAGNTITINPTVTLSYNTDYSIEFAAGTIKDIANNNYAGTSTYNFTTLATPDELAPTISSFSPTEGQTGVAVDGNVVVSFSEDIARGTGNILIKDAAGATVASYDVATSNNLALSGTALTINPSSNLAAGIAYIVEIPSGAIVDLSGNPFAGESTYTFTTVAGTLTGTAAANTINGTAGMDAISGLAGNDKLNGLAGADTLDGGVGNDILDGGEGADSLIGAAGLDKLTGGAGSDNLNGGLANDILDGGDGDDTLVGDAGIDKLTGGAGNDNMDGGLGNDSLDGGLGADSMQGGAGNDIFLVDNVADTVADTAGIDLVKSSVSFSLGADLENLTLTGAALDNLTATGNSLNNALIGDAGNNSLSGADGNDVLTGNLGNDTLLGGNGIDKLVGGKGDDTYVVNLKTATVKKVFVASLQDTVVEVAGAANGNDTVQLSGGTVDLVKASTISLAATLENLDATDTGNTLLHLNGNALANHLTGNDAANLMKGLGGNDTLSGGAGADTLNAGLGIDSMTGGADADVFVFDSKLNAISNVDTITDFTSGADSLQLSKVIFAKLKGDLDLTDNLFVSGVGTQDANDYLVYDSATGGLSYDVDGVGVKAAIKFATLGTDTHPELLGSDIFVI